MTRLLSLVLMVFAGCADTDVDEQQFSHTFVLTNVEIDPTSSLGGALGDAGVFADLVDGLDLLDCDGIAPVLLELGGSRIGSSGRGEARLLFSQHVDYDLSCTGEGEFLIDPFSLEEPEARGPLWVEGPSFEGRLDPGAALGTAVGILFEDWLTVSGVMHGDGSSVDFGRVRGVWTVDYLHGLLDEPTGLSWLDLAVADFGAQPDVDRDADGLERLEDRDGDGRVDTCIDGDGSRVEGDDCALDARFSDAFAFVLLYRVEQAEIVGVSEVTLFGGGVIGTDAP